MSLFHLEQLRLKRQLSMETKQTLISSFSTESNVPLSTEKSVKEALDAIYGNDYYHLYHNYYTHATNSIQALTLETIDFSVIPSIKEFIYKQLGSYIDNRFACIVLHDVRPLCPDGVSEYIVPYLDRKLYHKCN